MKTLLHFKTISMLIIIISKPFEAEVAAEDSVVDKGLIVDSDVTFEGSLGLYVLVEVSLLSSLDAIFLA